jgi:putative alpha-1,2-mannosidase
MYNVCLRSRSFHLGILCRIFTGQECRSDPFNKEGRGALDDWLNVGWLTRNHTRSISRTVEYAQNDFSLYQIAKRTNRTADAKKYLARARQWENMWNPDMVSNLTVGNFSGFLTPRDADGKWNLTGISGVEKFNATDCGGCEWDSDTYEATSWEYSMNVPVSINLMQ